ncbi:MAG: GTPase Era [Porticoccaceae bacterium]
MNSDAESHCGTVAIVGRPNVGKSTLLNHILGVKLSITSRKPQTTRTNVLGIKTVANYQLVFVDTPGIHSDRQNAINRHMNRMAKGAIRDVDVIVFVVDRTLWSEADAVVAHQVAAASVPVIVAINKVDRLTDNTILLPHFAVLADLLPGCESIPVSALRGINLAALETAVSKHIPAGPFHFPVDQFTDRSERFLAAELVREKITRQLGAELPYQIAVEIEEFEMRGKIRHISALILVEREGQKKIIIGESGQRIKKIGQQARLDMEMLFGGKVMLNLWVKVRSGWSDDERALRSLGYQD